MRRSALVIAAPAIAVAVLVLAPFLGGAYMIDDTLFLREAQQMLHDPLNPGGFDIMWDATREPLSAILSNGPMGAALLLPTVALDGAEWVAHLTQLAMLAIALVATARLALRLHLSERDAAVACLVLATTPAVLGMAGTAMPDVGAMALGVLGLERVYAYRDDGRWHQAVAAALALALAMLARPHHALLVGVGALALPRRRWLPLVAAPLVAWACTRLCADSRTGASFANATARYSTGNSIDRNLVAYATHLVLALPLALPWTIVHWRRMPWRVAAVALPVAGVLILLSGEPQWLYVAPIAALGATVAADIVVDAWRRRELVLAAWLLVPLPVVIYIHLPSKYMLVAAPAIAILVAQALAGTRWLATATIAASLVLGVAILRAETRYANLGRRAAHELVAAAHGHRVWTLGRWGFLWYAEREGVIPLGAPPPVPAPGDYVITVALSAGDFDKYLPAHRRLVTSVSDDDPGGRVMSRSADAGFFTTGAGFLPWSWSTQPVDRYELWQVEE